MPPTKPTPQLEFGLFGHSRCLVDVPEAARALGVSETTVHGYIASGYLLVMPAEVRTNGDREHLRIFRYSVEAFLAERSSNRNGIAIPFTETPEHKFWRAHLKELFGAVKQRI